jgi:rhamnulokinase
MSSSPDSYLAVDLGASSGRVLAGALNGQRLDIQELYRFDNGPVRVQGRLYWDLLSQWTQIQDGLRKAVVERGESVRSVGVDTWGVDFGLLGRGDELLGNPRHYRDPQTQGLMDEVLQAASREEIFQATGLQFMELNTLFQLIAMRRANSPLLEAATDFLMMPDLFHWLLTGEKANERTNATTTQFFDPRQSTWAASLLEKFDIPTQMLGRILPPGSILGGVSRGVAEATGLRDVQVVLPGTHDTASAVLAVPSRDALSAQPPWCYISCGTWSLMGVEVPRPVVTAACLNRNFTNEGGVGGTTRLLKNIAGLWVLQECRRVWYSQGREYSWDELARLAAEAAPLVSLIDPDLPQFMAPDDMPAAIRQFCAESGQPVPATDGAIVRCGLESLALRHRLVLGWLEELTGAHIGTVHMVGGGTRNRQLCQMTADACNRPVLAGPVEATAIGNLTMQAIALGHLASIAEARELVRASFDVQEYLPYQPERWEGPFARFKALADTGP